MQETTLNNLRVDLHTDVETAVARVTAALKTEGFGVLTDIDMQTTFKNKIDVDFRDYRILGACSPALAHAALSQTPAVGLLLPCNVVVEQVDDTTTAVQIVNPVALLSLVDAPGLADLAADVEGKFRRVLTALQEDK